MTDVRVTCTVQQSASSTKSGPGIPAFNAPGATAKGSA
ncbi:hypothetical protein FHX50_000353 [Helcobacillus massiliensis]|uniref:Uncharacterized protein n=1 Tax=Helcobacillus massiliensis TaxID=521392 RepID=A0A839QQQ3_9MICO|nr:hypothetical protein [Helcobacillus massiliensis]